MLLNFFIFLAKIPSIIGAIIFLWLVYKVVKAFYKEVLLDGDETFAKKFIGFFDPYKQSFLFFRYKLISVLLILLATFVLSLHYCNPQLLPGGYPVQNILTNPFTGLPNYLIHETAHNVMRYFGFEWWTIFSGSFIEAFVPFILCCLLLRPNGGRYFLPLFSFWLSTALYSAGKYAYFGSSKELALTSSDMMTNLKSGSTYGDWYYILKPLGLLEYDKFIGNAIIVAACFCLVITCYSVYYYIRYDAQYPFHPGNSLPADYEKPDAHFDNIYQGPDLK
jgi:hypothetical protein